MHARATFLTICLLGSLVSVSDSAESLSEDPPAKFFLDQCSACHTVGRGDLDGPDLVGVLKWSESDLRSAIRRMEENTGPLSEEDVNAMTAFLRDSAAAGRLMAQEQRAAVGQVAAASKPSAQEGADLFSGRKAFKNGGPPCAGCHLFSSAGGTLGPDLTGAKNHFSRASFQSAIQKAAYKVMRPIYEKRPVSAEEAAQVAEYLSSEPKAEAGLVMSGRRLGAWGGALAAILLGMLWVVNRSRRRSSREILFKKKSR